MGMFTRSERRMLLAVRLTTACVCIPVLAFAGYAGSLMPALIVAPLLALLVGFEIFALWRRFRWTMRSPKEIARERRMARERGEA